MSKKGGIKPLEYPSPKDFVNSLPPIGNSPLPIVM